MIATEYHMLFFGGEAVKRLKSMLCRGMLTYAYVQENLFTSLSGPWLVFDNAKDESNIDWLKFGWVSSEFAMATAQLVPPQDPPGLPSGSP